jgi:hypothetical protein
MTMFIKQALILSKHQKTDAEIKVIMSGHPWGKMVYGAYRAHEDQWDPEIGSYYWCDHPDAFWCDLGLFPFRGTKWIVRDMDEPDLSMARGGLSWDPTSPWSKRKDDLEEQWWNAICALILHQIPSGYHACLVCYGSVEDEEDDQLEAAWRESILSHLGIAIGAAEALGLIEFSQIVP